MNTYKALTERFSVLSQDLQRLETEKLGLTKQGREALTQVGDLQLGGKQGKNVKTVGKDLAIDIDNRIRSLEEEKQKVQESSRAIFSFVIWNEFGHIYHHWIWI